MAKKSKYTPEQLLQNNCKNIIDEINSWNHYQNFGGQDPFWADGTNMNLIRNHIIYYKGEIKKLCEENGFDLPDEYYLATPPEVPDNYMANNKQNQFRKIRTERIEQNGHKVTHKKTEYNPEQISLF